MPNITNCFNSNVQISMSASAAAKVQTFKGNAVNYFKRNDAMDMKQRSSKKSRLILTKKVNFERRHAES